jgi:ribonuclease HI
MMNKKSSDLSEYTLVSNWELYVDGASRNNPGPAGAGFYLLKEGKPVEMQGMYLGKKTNNQAEYLALLLGVYYAQQHMGPNDTLVIKSDSELMVRQVNGIYKIKNKELAQMYGTIRTMLDALHFKIQHVPREQNKVADKLANEGIDKKIRVPQELLLVWPIYENTL